MSINENNLFRDFQNAYTKYLNVLHRFFVDNSIVYFLSGTTLLGSHVSQDFLINEDSVHLSLLYSDYKKLIAAADQLPDLFELSAPEGKQVNAYCSQLVLTIKDKKFMFKDKPMLTYFIHPIIGAPADKKTMMSHEKKIETVSLKIAAKRHEPRQKRCNWFLWIWYILFAGNLAKLLDLHNNLIFNIYDYNKTKNCIMFYNGKRLHQKPISFTVFAEPRYYLFSNVFFFGPKDPMVVLNLLFPDYDYKSSKAENALSTMNYLVNTDYFFRTDKNKVDTTTK